ncbi:MAG: hypothetical protein CMD85_00045 [Gammaproteobacteria bacterium]|nr:hypothetical protein [Gammaproteobacteria bacterium]|tara:strand:+ start:85 stop:450 length:366 start_codon:yes stop_codon:yes gene_type:complete
MDKGVYLIDQLDWFLDLSKYFCEFTKKAVKEKKILRVMHVPEDRFPNNISFYVDINEPCCFLHALSALEDEFIKRWEKKYKEELTNFPTKASEEFDFSVIQIEFISEDNEALTVAFHMVGA